MNLIVTFNDIKWLSKLPVREEIVFIYHYFYSVLLILLSCLLSSHAIFTLKWALNIDVEHFIRGMKISFSFMQKKCFLNANVGEGTIGVLMWKCWLKRAANKLIKLFWWRLGSKSALKFKKFITKFNKKILSFAKLLIN